MEQETKFGRGTTLRDAIRELNENGMNEITRIERKEEGVTFHYNIN